ncbi:MAG: histidine phosphatase family protein [Myxococcota bacterium]
MEILLVRHGEPVTLVSEDGPVDPHLTERGLWQAERLGAWLAHEAIDHVVASNKTRAIQTAAPAAARLGLETEIVPDLAEIDRNSRIYASPAVLAERFPDYFAAMQAGEYEKIGWDSYEDFQARVLRGWDDLVAQPRGERVLVACHGGTIGVILSHVIGASSHAIFDSTPYASVTRLLLVEGHARVRTLHEVAHFDGERLTAHGVEGPPGIQGAQGESDPSS